MTASKGCVFVAEGMEGRLVLDAPDGRRPSEVQRLPRETDCSIEEVCGKAGFNDASGLRRLFHRACGLSMRECRRVSPARRGLPET